MAPRAYKVEPLSPGHWDRITPPVDQELWKRYLNEDDSDSDSSDTEHGEMAGPLSSAKSTRPEAPEGKPKNKDELIKEVLDDAFNDQIYQILNGVPTEEVITSKEQAPAAKSGPEITTTTSGLEICSNCSLPRLTHPRIGLNSRPPPDPTAQYCANEPPIVLSGHDVHGNAFPGFKPKNPTNSTTTATATSAAASAAGSSKPTKPKPLAKPPTTSTTTAATATASTASSPSSSQSSSTPTNPPSSAAEYPQIRTPQMRCPNPSCAQFKAVNVMAKHLDACLLGKGRRAGREARERIGATGTGTGTPGEGSRAGTPRPSAGISAGVKRDRAGEGKGELVGAGAGGRMGKKLKKTK